MNICLVRHGETDWNKVGKLQGHTDIELNKNGILQANACADYLSNTPSINVDISMAHAIFACQKNIFQHAYLT